MALMDWLLRYMIRRGLLRLVPRMVLATCPGYVRQYERIVGRAADTACSYVCHEVDESVARIAVWMDLHKWSLHRLALRLGVLVIAEGDYYRNARLWFRTS